MTEYFLHYIWQFKLFNAFDLKTIDGEPLVILKYGSHNDNGGPDFTDGLIRIGKTTLAGTIEIHTKSTDWIKHKHHLDAAYEGVILHVVYEHDIKPNEAKLINKPTLVLKGLIKEDYWNVYNEWLTAKRDIPCGNALRSIKPFDVQFWLERLFIERLSEKVLRIRTMMDEMNNNKEEIAYSLLLHYFGGMVNSAATERLGKLLPYTVLMKHRNQLEVMEALLFGVAGFLQKPSKEDYINNLKSHFDFYKGKYSLRVMNETEWKLLRMRPASFPTYRIAQLASFLQWNFPLYAMLTSVNSISDFENRFNWPVSQFWSNPNHFNKGGHKVAEKPGKDFIRNLLINVNIPLMYFEGDWLSNDLLKDAAIELANKLPAEENRITRLFKVNGIVPHTALESQACIQLYHNYCKHKKCLSCSFGYEILTK